jgi:2-isopropylmalate synthase
VGFTVQNVTEGIDAQATVVVTIEGPTRRYSGQAANTDIIVASARAYTNALNRMFAVMAREEQNRTSSAPKS